MTDESSGPANPDSNFKPKQKANTMMTLPRLAALLLVATCAALLAGTADAKPYNVLFVGVDDLRVQLNSYGFRQMKTPNFDRLAVMGMQFNRAYVQQAVCAASRASFLTGCRPDSTGASKWWKYPQTGIDQENARQLIHSYYACVSFVDAQIGKILDELQAQDLLDSTIVIVWSDHGWHLGDHGMWGKSTCFEWATRSPLFVYVPCMQEHGKPTDALVEYVDLYPTALDLCDLPIPDYLEGTSFAPLLQDASISWKQAAFSQFPRGDKEGYSMRTKDYRYTQWRTRDDKLMFEELYDERENLIESKNVAAALEYKSVLNAHREMFARGWKAALPPGAVNRSNLPRGDDSWYYQSKQAREQTRVQKPKKGTASNGSGQSSENKPWIKSFFEKNPAADANGDGVLTLDEANRFKSQKSE